MNQTATPIEWIWTLVSLIGFIASVCRIWLTLEQRTAVLADKDASEAVRRRRVNVANRRLWERGSLCAFFLGAMVVGFVVMADVAWVEAVLGWVLVSATAVLAAASVIALSAEIRKQ